MVGSIASPRSRSSPSAMASQTRSTAARPLPPAAASTAPSSRRLRRGASSLALAQGPGPRRAAPHLQPISKSVHRFLSEAVDLLVALVDGERQGVDRIRVGPRAAEEFRQRMLLLTHVLGEGSNRIDRVAKNTGPRGEFVLRPLDNLRHACSAVCPPNA